MLPARSLVPAVVVPPKPAAVVERPRLQPEDQKVSWLSKSVKKLGKSVETAVKKAASNPLAFVNPATYTGGATTGATVAAAAGKSGSTGADLGGSAAVIGGGALATAGVVGGGELKGVAEAGKQALGRARNRLPKGADLFKFASGLIKDWTPGQADASIAANTAATTAAFDAGAPMAQGQEAGGAEPALLIYGGIGLAALVVVAILARGR